MDFGTQSYTYEGTTYHFGQTSKPSGYSYIQPGISVVSTTMSCCGLGTIAGFYQSPFTGESIYGKDGALVKFQNRAKFLEAFCGRWWSPGHFIYVLEPTQLRSELHQLFLEIGATKIAEFPNLTHGPAILQMFLVNVREATGKYLDDNRKALTEPPKPKEPEVPVVIDATPIPAEATKKRTRKANNVDAISKDFQ